MLRRTSLCLAVSMLLLAPGCRKKAGTDEAKDDAESAKTAEPAKDAEEPAKVEEPAKADPAEPPVADPATGAGAGGSGGSGGSGLIGGSGGSASARLDLTCDPEDSGACLEGEQCIGGQGCDAVWTCDADIVCVKGVTEYCGCDGRTFEAVYGNCPWTKYQYPGPCK
jgi:hypothetical protein